jgi:hypothetical protein
MPIEPAAVKEVERLLQTPLEKIAARELEKRGGLAALRSAIRDLQGLSKNAVESLSRKLPAIIKAIIDGPVYRRIEKGEAPLAVLLFGRVTRARWICFLTKKCTDNSSASSLRS